MMQLFLGLWALVQRLARAMSAYPRRSMRFPVARPVLAIGAAPPRVSLTPSPALVGCFKAVFR